MAETPAPEQTTGTIDNTLDNVEVDTSVRYFSIAIYWSPLLTMSRVV